ncbi:MAG: alpha-galactosidase [Victivallaceae bacterium]|nr:alpha-galactosidase [Victivallaceae bacterium]
MKSYTASDYLQATTSESLINLTMTGDNTWSSERFTLTTTVAKIDNGIMITPTLQYSGECDRYLEAIEIINIKLPHNALRFLRFGLNMPGDPVRFGSIDKNGLHPPAIPLDNSFYTENDTRHLLSNSSLLAFATMDRKQLTLIGNSTFKVSEGTIILSCDKTTGQMQLIYKAKLDGLRITNDFRKNLDPIVIITGDDLNSLLEQWANHTATQIIPLIPATTPTGWNDWQYYRNEKTQEDVLDSAEVIAELKSQGYPLDFVQVDGGFCMHLSEWSMPRSSFSDGIRALSQKVTGMGLKFGLWLAPYIQNLETKVVKGHPEWLLLDKNGKPVKMPNSNVGPSSLIDYSLDESLEWLCELVKMFVNDWQVTWIKLDGPNYALYRLGRLRNPSMTITEMLIRSFEVIREAAGPDVLVEGEGMMGLALGRVDMHRVQTDNHPKWYQNNQKSQPYAPQVYGKELIMAFMHNRWWCNHRENIILRNNPSELVAEQTGDGNSVEQIFSEPEFRTQLTASALSPGGLLLTDPLKDLQRYEERMTWISKLLPVYPKAAQIIDQFPDQRYASLYRTQVNDDFTIIGMTNWSEQIQDFTVPLTDNDEYYLFSFFDRKNLGIVSGKLTVKGLTAHDSKLLALRRKTGQPQLLSTDMHLMQGAVDIGKCEFSDNMLTIEVVHFKQDDAKLYLVAAGKKISEITTDAKRWTVDDFDPEFPILRFEGNAPMTKIKIHWA